jgi:hypothetical protein
MTKYMFLIFLVLQLSSIQSQADGEFKINSLEDLEDCGNKYTYDTSKCLAPLKKYVESNPEMALTVAKKGHRYFTENVLLPFYAKAYFKSKDGSICKDKDFQVAFLNSLGQMPSDESYQAAEKLAASDCSAELIGPLMNELNSSTGTAFLAVACPVIKKHGKDHKNCLPKVEKVVEKAKVEQLPNLNKKKTKVTNIKIYQGPEGIKLIMGKVDSSNPEEKDLYLVKFEGIDGPWNNKTILHKAVRVNSTGGLDYWTNYGEEQWRSILAAQCYGGYCQYNVYVPEGSNNGFIINYNQRESSKYKVKNLLKTW